jgi:SAM-dependent methyltransferase
MVGIRERLCYEIARRMIKPPPARNLDMNSYNEWRRSELEGQWHFFSSDDIRGRDVIDFGCGAGSLSFALAELEPKQIVGIELDPRVVDEANANARKDARYARIRFVTGAADRLPFDDETFDTILAFDCVEHVMEPEPIFDEWKRVLRPGGKVLIWWSPYRSPYGPHMEGIVPIPWAHVIFGQRAMLRAAARIYDSDDFIPLSWHLDERGKKKPNAWKKWASFREQGYINELTQDQFLEIARRVGLSVTRFEAHSFSGSVVRRLIGHALVKLPLLGEFMTSYYVVECTRPAAP